jgi:hypothetical protein
MLICFTGLTMKEKLMSTVSIKTPNTNVRFKSIALPVEHGGWAFLIEPLLLGMLLAPSLSGLFLCIAAFGVFLLYQPLQLAIKDRRRDKRYPRTVWAERFVLIYSGIVVIGGLGILLVNAGSFQFVVLAVLAAAPFACIQMLMVIWGHARDAITEICGAIALGVTVSAIVMMQGWSPVLAFAFWLIPILRAAASILYVRIRVRLGRGEKVNKTWPIIAHILSVIVITGMVIARLLPVGSLFAMLILLARAVYGLYAARADTPTRIIGFQEIAFGLVTILLVVVSYRLSYVGR